MRTQQKEHGIAVAEISNVQDPSTSDRATTASAETSTPKMSAHEINQLRDTFDRFNTQLADARERHQKISAGLSQVIEKETKARRLLSLTGEIAGFSSDRQYAADLLLELAKERSELETQAQRQSTRMEQLKRSISEIDSSWFGKQEEVFKLIRELKAG